MISIGSHFFVLSELLRPRNNSSVFELPDIQVKDNKAELDPRKLPVRRSKKCLNREKHSHAPCERSLKQTVIELGVSHEDIYLAYFKGLQFN